MNETDKKRILERLENMRGELLAKIRPREQRYETEKPPEQPYVFLQQRMEKAGKIVGGLPDFIQILFGLIRFWR
ncbi:hypothetical protein GA0061105_101377 [Rhizobium aethiopicum]|uniref:Chorismate mutase n=1 Tax=Rhizobium aethiopicum TaxID=1138170 RepID=A0A1C3XWD3_9HYPH|nr:MULTISPECIES: hypothetical protein [Rhizobium]TLX09275.1 hypothetical protein FFR93_25840 [Rhizobium sp. MHM7A]SCB56548.1 hypothetical protein GA0061105_101377 [Rhizobium aethiopicum]